MLLCSSHVLLQFRLVVIVITTHHYVVTVTHNIDAYLLVYTTAYAMFATCLELFIVQDQIYISPLLIQVNGVDFTTITEFDIIPYTITTHHVFLLVFSSAYFMSNFEFVTCLWKEDKAMDFWSNIKQNIQHMNFEECKYWLLCEQENPSDRPSVQQTFHAWK